MTRASLASLGLAALLAVAGCSADGTAAITCEAFCQQTRLAACGRERQRGFRSDGTACDLDTAAGIAECDEELAVCRTNAEAFCVSCAFPRGCTATRAEADMCVGRLELGDLEPSADEILNSPICDVCSD